MCGIAGIFSTLPLDPLKACVERIVKSQHSRGPDFSAIEVISSPGAGIIMGHNRARPSAFAEATTLLWLAGTA